MKKKMKRLIKKLFPIKVNEKGDILIKRFPFVHRVYLQSQNKNDSIYFARTPQFHIINFFTVENIFEKKLYFEIKIFFLTFSFSIPYSLSKLISPQSKYRYFCQQPIKKGLIFFESFFGKSYAGQPKYIYEYLLNQETPYTYVWVYNKKSQKSIKGNPIIVKRGSTEYFKYAAQAEYLVNNIVFPFFPKREESVYLQTWHGTPLKKLGFDIQVSGPETEAREKFYQESRGWDFLITQNRYTTDILRRAFKFEKEIIESGYPHNDLLVCYSEDQVANIKKKLNIDSDKKIILYAPTWRDNLANGHWSFDFELPIDLLSWKQKIGDEYILLIRMHHLITNIKNMSEVGDFAINVSDYDDVQELSLISDILITDYSSIFFDFAVSGKPILFYTYDLDEYESQLRGFYLDMNTDVPGPLCMTESELLTYIENIDGFKSQYKDRYEAFRKKFCYLDQGRSSERVVQRVFKGME